MPRSNTQQSVSLFPFLAVLICTMGALILVLLLTTRQIREQVEQARSEVVQSDDAEPIASDVEPLSEDEAPPIVSVGEPSADKPNEPKNLSVPDELPAALISKKALDADQAEVERLQTEVATAKKAQKELADRRADLAAVISELEEKVEQATEPDDLQQQVRKLTALKDELKASEEQQKRDRLELRKLYGTLDDASETTQQAESLLHKRESALIMLREMAEEAETRPSEGTDATLIQFTNSTGTTQHPVIIELNADGLVFQPSGVAISPSDLEGFTALESPLVTGILAAHNALPSRPIMQQPYALLLVRPEGSLAFYTAQRILTAANIHFGYELLEPDRKIALKTPHYDERTVIVSAIEKTMRRRQQLYGDLVERINRIKQKAAEDAQPFNDPRNRSSGRRLQVGPDGQLREITDPDEPLLPGRFYAGGSAPPPGFRRRDNDQRQDRFGKPRQSAGHNDTDSLVNQGQMQATNPTSSGVQNQSNGFPDNPDSRVFVPKISQNGIVQLPSGSAPTGHSAAHGVMGGTVPSNANGGLNELLAILGDGQSPGSEQINSFQNSEADGLSQNEGTSADSTSLPNRSSPNDIVRVNPFVNTDGTSPPGVSSDVPPGNTRGPAQQFARSQGQSISTAAPQPKQNSTPLDWSNTVTATTESNSRPVAAADNMTGIPNADTNRTPQHANPRNTATLSPSGGPDADGPAPSSVLPDTTLQALEQFMSEAGRKKAAMQPNQYLVDLMTGKISAPPTARIPVTVTLQNNLLQVGDLVAIDISQHTDDQLLELTLNGINTQLASRPDGGRTAVPVLDFVVDDTTRGRLAGLQDRLQKLDVPTRAIQNVPNTSTRFIELLKKNAALAAPAAPVDISPPESLQGRIRL